MQKHKKLQIFLVVLLIFSLSLGTITAAVFASRFPDDLQTSVLRIKKQKRARRIIKSALAYASADGTRRKAAVSCDVSLPEKPEYKAEFMAPEVRVNVQADEDFDAFFYVKNTGNMPWFNGSSGCGGVNQIKLGTARDRDRKSIFYREGGNGWLEPQRIGMVEARVDSGEIATFTFRSKAPKVHDIYREYFQPVVEGAQWIENKEALGRIDVAVGVIPPELEKGAFYLGRTGQASAIDIYGEPLIDVDISEQRLRLFLGESEIREYIISSGTFKTPTPLGRFKVLERQELRIGNKWQHYRMPMFQMFTPYGHGFHGLPYLVNDQGIFWNEALEHIGRPVSHGCVRLLQEDAEELYSLTDVGTQIVIHE
ncbi:L,D-transpeptidase [Candidatus Peregrinibacteria bacterium]|nr:L,D-transpeptidase [Candidatus Peregrinibacteria bacterium]